MGHQLNASLIVAGTGGRQGVAALFAGHTAEKLVTRTRIPLLTVRAPGFDTHIGKVIDLVQPAHVDVDQPGIEAATA